MIKICFNLLWHTYKEPFDTSHPSSVIRPDVNKQIPDEKEIMLAVKDIGETLATKGLYITGSLLHLQMGLKPLSTMILKR